MSERGLVAPRPSVAVAAMFFLNGAFFGAWAARIPSVKASFSLDAADLGLLLLLLAGGAIIAFPVAGAATDRYRAAPVTRALAIAYVVALGWLALAPTLWLLALALFAFGAVHGAMDVAMNAWGAEVERAQKRSLLPMFHALFSLGAGAGALFGAVAIGWGWNVTTHFLVFGIGIGAPCLLLSAAPWASPPATTRGGGRMFALPSGTLLPVGVIAFCVALGEGAMADWSAVFLVETVAANEATAALGYAIFSTAMVAMRLSGGTLATRLGPVAITRLAGLTSFLGVTIAIASHGAYGVLLGYGLMGLGYALVFPLAISRAANDPERAPGAAIAAVATLGYGGMLIGPPVIGFLAAATTFQISFGLLALLSLLSIRLAGSLQR